MKNRALFLCMRDGIRYAEQYAEMIGVSVDTATAILDEEIVIPDEVVNRNCELFNVSKEYFLCII